jgi:hypothetical protein
MPGPLSVAFFEHHDTFHPEFDEPIGNMQHSRVSVPIRAFDTSTNV